MSPIAWNETPVTPTDDQAAAFASYLEYSEDGDVALRVVTSGPCPNCGDATEDRQWLLTGVANLVETDDDDAAIATLEMRLRSMRQRGAPIPTLPPEILQEMACKCLSSHDGRPAGSQGCGAFWSLRLAAEAST